MAVTTVSMHYSIVNFNIINQTTISYQGRTWRKWHDFDDRRGHEDNLCENAASIVWGWGRML